MPKNYYKTRLNGLENISHARDIYCTNRLNIIKIKTKKNKANQKYLKIAKTNLEEVMDSNAIRIVTFKNKSEDLKTQISSQKNILTKTLEKIDVKFKFLFNFF